MIDQTEITPIGTLVRPCLRFPTTAGLPYWHGGLWTTGLDIVGPDAEGLVAHLAALMDEAFDEFCEKWRITARAQATWTRQLPLRHRLSGAVRLRFEADAGYLPRQHLEEGRRLRPFPLYDRRGETLASDADHGSTGRVRYVPEPVQLGQRRVFSLHLTLCAVQIKELAEERLPAYAFDPIEEARETAPRMQLLHGGRH